MSTLTTEMPKYYVKSVLATIIFTPSNLGTLSGGVFDIYSYYWGQGRVGRLFTDSVLSSLIIFTAAL